MVRQVVVGALAICVVVYIRTEQVVEVGKENWQFISGCA